MKGLLPKGKTAAHEPGAELLALSLTLSSAVLMTMVCATPPSVAATAKKPAGKASVIDRNPALSKANALSLDRKYTEAIEQYKLAVTKDPGNFQCFQMYGRTLAKMGMIDEALEQYQKGFRIKGNDAELCNDIGVALFVNDRYGDGARYLRKATQLSPRYIAAYNNLGVALQKLGDFNQARDAYMTSLKLQPTNNQIQKRLDAILPRLSESKSFEFGAPVDASTLDKPATADTANPANAPAKTAQDPTREQTEQTAEEKAKQSEQQAAEPGKTGAPTKEAEPVKAAESPKETQEQTVTGKPPREPVKKQAPARPVETAARKTPPRPTAPIISPANTPPPVAVSRPFSNKSSGMEDISTSVPGLPVTDKPGKTAAVDTTIPPVDSLPVIPPGDVTGTAGSATNPVTPPADPSVTSTTGAAAPDPTPTTNPAPPSADPAATTAPSSTQSSVPASTSSDTGTTSSAPAPAAGTENTSTTTTPPTTTAPTGDTGSAVPESPPAPVEPAKPVEAYPASGNSSTTTDPSSPTAAPPTTETTPQTPVPEAPLQ